MWCEMINSWLTACSSCGWLSYLQKYSHKISCINISRCDLDTGAGGGGAAAASVSSPKRDWERVRRLTWSISTMQYSTVQYSTVQHSTVQYSTVHNQPQYPLWLSHLPQVSAGPSTTTLPTCTTSSPSGRKIFVAHKKIFKANLNIWYV